MMLKNSLLLVLSVCFLILSCDKKAVFDSYKTVGSAWHKDSTVTFRFKPKDTFNRHHIFIHLRNNKDYPYSNLFLIATLEDPEGLVKKDTLEYLMAYPDGSFMGTGFSDIKENKLFYKENIRFKSLEEHMVTIEQAVRQTGKIQGIEKLPGVTEVGLRIEKNE